ncbi:MAG TPA: HAMP domain-containing protein, partial [Polyangiaceae bacterium]
MPDLDVLSKSSRRSPSSSKSSSKAPVGKAASAKFPNGRAHGKSNGRTAPNGPNGKTPNGKVANGRSEKKSGVRSGREFGMENSGDRGESSEAIERVPESGTSHRGVVQGEERLLAALSALVEGDFGVRLPVHRDLDPRLAGAVNALAARLSSMSDRFARLARVVGRDGDMRARFDLEDCRGGWAGMGESFNTLTNDLARPSTEVARVLAAVAAGDLSQKMPLEIDGKPLRGEFLRIGTTVNTMVDELNGLAREVTRVAREVGTEGKLGGQANVPGVAGIWLDL